MTSKCTVHLPTDLGITRSLGRPRITLESGSIY